MPTIIEVRKMKKELESKILDTIKDFEKSGVQISYISINREPDEWEKDTMQRSNPEVPSDASQGSITSVSVDLKIDLD